MDKFWRATCLFKLIKCNLCGQVKDKFMWFIRFAVFCVHEYWFHAYILTIIVQSRFFFLFSATDSLLVIINSFSCFKFSSTFLGQRN